MELGGEASSSVFMAKLRLGDVSENDDVINVTVIFI